MITVWVVSGKSESGDDYGPYVFSQEPTKDALKKLALSCDSTDELDGPGDFGSHVYLHTSKVEIDAELRA